MTRIVLFIRSLGIGGAERQLVALARGLHARGLSVQVLTFYAGGALRSELEAAGVAVADLAKRGRWDILPFLFCLWRWLRHHKPDVLYSWLPTANTLAATFGHLAGVPRIVWGVRASNMDLSRYDWASRLDFFIARKLAHRAHRIICNSREGLRFHVAHGYPADKMCVIENGIDTERFRFDPAGRQRLREEWKIGAGETVIGLVARLDPMKDHETFLRAAAILIRSSPDVRFVCVGAGPASYQAELVALAAQIGVGERVIWTGERHDLPAVYSAFDIASSSSYGEGFSNAIAEAMACERPCVVTDVGDSARIVGETGLIVPARDPAALAWAWHEAIRSLGKEQHGAMARRRVMDGFSVHRMVKETSRIMTEP